MKLAQALDPRAAHENTLVMRRSSGFDPIRDLPGSGCLLLITSLLITIQGTVLTAGGPSQAYEPRSGHSRALDD